MSELATQHIRSRIVSTFDAFKSLTALAKSERRAADAQIPPLLGKIGSLEVRLVKTRSELRAAQRLRYDVFYKEMSARRTITSRASGLDIDLFDNYCDHLIVVDTAVTKTGFASTKSKIVGTYRLLRQEQAAQCHGFYSQSEYDVDRLIGLHPDKRFLELGRSCVLEDYRTKRTVELLWHGIWTYVLHHKIDVMFGCASLEGTDPALLREQLSALCDVRPTPQDWQVRAHDTHYVEMSGTCCLSKRKALASLPPLIKGYLRIGAYVGDGAVIDHSFGTTDVLIILPVENINPRYVSYYGDDASRHAA